MINTNVSKMILSLEKGTIDNGIDNFDNGPLNKYKINLKFFFIDVFFYF
jgi:hypothetical protein